MTGCARVSYFAATLIDSGRTLRPSTFSGPARSLRGRCLKEKEFPATQEARKAREKKKTHRLISEENNSCKEIPGEKIPTLKNCLSCLISLGK